MPSAHVFRPRLPLDPFQSNIHNSWPVQSIHKGFAHIILVLGSPSQSDLASITTSPHLAHSLLLIATHSPPNIPSSPSTGPAIIILRLPEPLHIHNAGALRLVSLLERAQRVAHVWRSDPIHQPHVQVLIQPYLGADFSSPQYSPLKSKSAKSIGQTQFTSLINFLPANLPEKALLKHAILVTTLAAPFLTGATPASPYLRPSINNRNSIFSSLSLSSRTSRTPRNSRLSSPPSSRSSPPSLFNFTPSRSPSVESLQLKKDPTPAQQPHIVHVLPTTATPHGKIKQKLPAPEKSRLAHTIEQFLLSFAYPSASSPSSLLSNNNPAAFPYLDASSSSLSSIVQRRSTYPTIHFDEGGPHPNSNLTTTTTQTKTTAIPYLLPADVLTSTLTVSTDGETKNSHHYDDNNTTSHIPESKDRAWVGARARVKISIAELLVLGAFDGTAAGMAVGEVGWPRAWIGDGGDVVWAGKGGGVTESVAAAAAAATSARRTTSSPLSSGLQPPYILRPEPLLLKSVLLKGDVSEFGSGLRTGDGREWVRGDESRQDHRRGDRRESEGGSWRGGGVNEAGLPTPPESTEGSGSGCESAKEGEGDGSGSGSDEIMDRGIVAPGRVGVDLGERKEVVEGKAEEGMSMSVSEWRPYHYLLRERRHDPAGISAENGKEKVKLRGRMSGFFRHTGGGSFKGAAEEPEGVVEVGEEGLGSLGHSRSGRLGRVWGSPGRPVRS